jgi:general L-amino acid transport system substrate-binding protein
MWQPGQTQVKQCGNRGRTLMRRLLLAACIMMPVAAHSGPRLDRIRADGIVHCGGAIRPGLAFPAPGGEWHGLEVDVCRAVAVAVLGPAGKADFHAYTQQNNSYDPVRQGKDDIAFLTAAEMLAGRVLPHVLPGPPVFFVTTGVMVMAADPAQRVADLGGKRICGEPGTGPERNLAAWFQAHGLALAFSPFQESDEMLDAFYSGRCERLVNETTSLAAIRLQAAADEHEARILPDVVAAVPLLATTPRGDDDWAAITGWTVQTLIRAEMRTGPGGAADGLPLAGPALGLPAGWQAAVVAATGSYADIFRRNLGAGSPLDLPRGLNALWNDGGLLCPPITE